MGTRASRVVAAIVLGLSATALRAYQEPTYKAGNRTVAWSAEAMWPLVVWAYWVDRHRAPA